MGQGKRPGYLKEYAEHAGISRQAAAEQLQRVQVNYLEPFDFQQADLLREAARHADRAAFSAPIMPPLGGEESVDPETKKDPKFIHFQTEKEKWKSKIVELEYKKMIGELIPADQVDREWFELTRLVRDSLLNIPARIADQLAHETDQRKVHDLLETEIYKALEALIEHEGQAA